LEWIASVYGELIDIPEGSSAPEAKEIVIAELKSEIFKRFATL